MAKLINKALETPTPGTITTLCRLAGNQLWCSGQIQYSLAHMCKKVKILEATTDSMTIQINYNLDSINQVIVNCFIRQGKSKQFVAVNFAHISGLDQKWT